MFERSPISRNRATGCLAALCACALLITGSPAGATRGESQEIKDPHYGEVLFYFYQQQYFTAITDLLTSQQFQRLSHHGDEAELLLGGMYLSYGLHQEAGRIFQRLIDAGIDLDNRNLTGATALMYTASSGKADMMQILLQNGADPMIRTDDDYLAVELAATVDCLRLLRHTAA